MSNLHPISTKQCSYGWEWPVQIVLINFGTQVLLRSIAPRSWWLRDSFLRSSLAILSSSCSEWMLLLIPPMRRCNNLCNSALLYYDIIVVWMWYSTRIWVIWSTMVLLHFDSVDFPSWKSGLFHDLSTSSEHVGRTSRSHPSTRSKHRERQSDAHKLLFELK